ncbi:MAG TPA: hypothetical protein VF006_24475 [Longimicrobium sp.]
MSILGFREKLVGVNTVSTLCTTLLLALFVSACGADAPTGPRAASVQATAAAADWTTGGESIYRGVFFGQGQVTQDVPELADAFAWRGTMDETQRAALDSFVDDLTATIQKTSPGFFEEFDRVMRSGDHVMIADMMDRAGDVTLRAMDQVPGVEDWQKRLETERDAVQKELIRMHDEGKMSAEDVDAVRAQYDLLVAAGSGAQAQMGRSKWSRGWALAVAVALAVAIVYPPALAVALAVVVAYAWAWSPRAASTAELDREQVVHAIATRLDAASAEAPATVD